MVISEVLARAFFSIAHVGAPARGALEVVGNIAFTLLMFELIGSLFMVLVFALVLALSAWWVRAKVVPVVDQYRASAVHAMVATEEGTDRAVQAVAEFYGRLQSIERTLLVMLFGRSAMVEPAAPPPARVVEIVSEGRTPGSRVREIIHQQPAPPVAPTAPASPATASAAPPFVVLPRADEVPPTGTNGHTPGHAPAQGASRTPPPSPPPPAAPPRA